MHIPHRKSGWVEVIFISLVSVVLPNFIRLIRLNVANRSLFSAQLTEATRPTQSGRNVA